MDAQWSAASAMVILLVLAGCLSGVGADADAGVDERTSATATPTTATANDATTESTASTESTATPRAPSGTVDFPDGPKERPERPATLDADAVEEYVYRYEYRFAYNSLWLNENSTVTLACRVDDVTERSWGYTAVVTCTGSSKTDGLNGDWFTQSYRYRVSETALDRTQIEPRDPVS